MKKLVVILSTMLLSQFVFAHDGHNHENDKKTDVLKETKQASESSNPAGKKHKRIKKDAHDHVHENGEKHTH
ncbi:MAG: hypothetical protein RLZZ210_160 [Pseudomonadota bacterium]|jgi:hypothetical protein